MANSVLQYIGRQCDVRWSVTWLAFFLISVLGVVDIPMSTLLSYGRAVNWIIVLSICCFKASIIVILLDLSRKYRLLYIGSVIIVSIYCLLCVCNFIAWYFYDMGITIKLLTVISQTNGEEVAEFIPSFMANVGAALSRPLTWITAVLVVFLFWVVTKLPVRIFKISALSVSVIGLVELVIICCTLSAGRTNFLVFGRTAKSILQTCRERKQMEEFMTLRKELPYSETVNSNRLADVFLVVGESASRGHWSLYGYPLSTTPNLDKINDGLVVFQDAIGSSTTTAFNMNRILTFLSDREDASEWADSPMLFDVMNNAGYNTAWLSNQEKSGMWSNATVAMVSRANTVKYVGSYSSDDATLIKLDKSLLPELDKYIHGNDRPKFVGLHLMGSHAEYRRRYPESFNHFNADSVLSKPRSFKLSEDHAQVVAEYDNSIRYTDSFLSEIISRVNSNERPAVMIYFSDHGENVYDDDNDFVGRDDKHVEVPFVIYANKRFRDAYPDLYANMVRGGSKPVSTADIEHMICTLTGTKYHYYNESLDVSSPRYVSKPRYVDDSRWRYEHVGSDRK